MAEMACKDCGSVAEPEVVTKGSIWIELILWLCFLVPGLIYSVWRLSSKYDACPVCHKQNLVPVDSPIGRNFVVDRPIEVIRPSKKAVNIGRSLGRLFAKK